MKEKIGILDYGAGNMINVSRAVEHLGYKFELVSSPFELSRVNKLIMPGVGAFPVAMDNLGKLGLIDFIIEFANEGNPILGICLGMQMLFEKSSEKGITSGLGLLKGSIKKIPSDSETKSVIKIPHIGWNNLIINDSENELVKNINISDSVYFVHSYMAVDYSKESLIASCSYGGSNIPAIVQNKNITGCQFHPEKSGKVGLKILENFLK